MKQSFFTRLTKLHKRRKSARVLRIPFTRGAWFSMPEEIWLDGRMVPLHWPAEDNTEGIFVEVLLDDCYGCVDMARAEIPVNTVLDIGGNIGLFGLAARRSFPGARIHAYEPNAALEPYLAAQAQTGQFDYFLEAVGGHEGRVSLEFGRSSFATSTRSDLAGDIPQVSLAQAIDRLGGQVDFAKIDCEGAEWDMLEDSAPWQHITWLAMEYHLFKGDARTAEDAINRVKELGFKVTSVDRFPRYGVILAHRD